jgi:hypothetical protein
MRLSQVQEEIDEMVNVMGAQQHVFLMWQESMLHMLIREKAVEKEKVGLATMELIAQLRSHADQFEAAGGPSPQVIRHAAKSLEADAQRYLSGRLAPGSEGAAS